MAGITDTAFRIICREMGCDLTYTEMVSAKGMHYNSENTKALLQLADIEKPSAVQLFGSEPQLLAKTAQVVEAMGIDIIDINMGCPAPKIVKNGDGSALMKNPRLIAEIIRAVVGAVKIPVTIKIRKGWDDSNINAVEIAKIAEDEGAAAITVHGRTREQFYSGKADWDIIKEVKQQLAIPVIGNGDIFTPQDAKAMLDYTGCDAVMIARGAQGNPWIFKRTQEYLKSGILLPEPTPQERIEMILRHTLMVVEFKGEDIGIKEMRKHAAWYLKGLSNSSAVKNSLQMLIEYKQIEQVLKEYLKTLNN